MIAEKIPFEIVVQYVDGKMVCNICGNWIEDIKVISFRIAPWLDEIQGHYSCVEQLAWTLSFFITHYDVTAEPVDGAVN